MALAGVDQPYWKEEEEDVEVGLKRRHESRRQEMEETAATTTVYGKDDTTDGIESSDVILITAITNTIPELVSRTEILTELPIPRLPLKTSLPEPDIQVTSSNINGTASNGGIATIQESRDRYTDMYLEPTFQKQPTQEFFCPKCNVCIRKVVLRDADWQFVPSPPPVATEPIVVPREDELICRYCFSFLIPVGRWFSTWIPVKKEDDEKEDKIGSEAGKEQIEDDRVDQARPPHELRPNGRGNLSPITVIPPEEKEETRKSSKGPVERDLPISTPTVAAPSAEAETEASAESGEGDKLEILKSIVYGGLAESITSLSVVTSAAAADVSSLDIIAMSLANLIGGFLIIIHNIWDLKAEQARTVLNENEEVDRYEKLLGKRKNFALHATFALLSFLVFGVEPPLVYGFSFRESNNRDYKLAVVAGASFLCISLLALGKAHIQKPPSYRGYLKTLVNYLIIGFAASGISYVAGDLIRKLLDKLGLFKSESEAAFFLPFNGESAVNPSWSSY